jgi:hypothetical protein
MKCNSLSRCWNIFTSIKKNSKEYAKITFARRRKKRHCQGDTQCHALERDQGKKEKERFSTDDSRHSHQADKSQKLYSSLFKKKKKEKLLEFLVECGNAHIPLISLDNNPPFSSLGG